MTEEFVLPSKIPWADLKAQDLEQLLYWLLDSMGAKDLQWRVGGTSTTTADGGRDLEATFYRDDPDGEVGSQRWWVESRGTGSTVAKRKVVDSVNLAEATGGIDLLVVATNGRFTNPTIDLINARNENRRQPTVRLWDRDFLERLVLRHPQVAARLMPEALTTQGRLAAATARFWDDGTYATPKDLGDLWDSRHELEWTERSIAAVLVSEAANGDYEQHPWGATFTSPDYSGDVSS